jgi:hypothetical protein
VFSLNSLTGLGPIRQLVAGDLASEFPALRVEDGLDPAGR